MQDRKTLTYGLSYWFYIPLGAAFLLALIIGGYQDTEHASLVVRVGFSFGLGLVVVFAGYVEIRKHRMFPYRVTMTVQGLKGEFVFQEPVFIPWDSISRVAQGAAVMKGSTVSALIKIESQASTCITVHRHIRGFESLVTELATRGLAPNWLSEQIQINGHDIPSPYSKPRWVVVYSAVFLLARISAVSVVFMGMVIIVILSFVGWSWETRLADIVGISLLVVLLSSGVLGLLTVLLRASIRCDSCHKQVFRDWPTGIRTTEIQNKRFRCAHCKTVSSLR